MSDAPAGGRAGWLADHIGRLAGAVLGAFVLGLLVFLAVAGFRPALFVVVFFATGLVLIIGGGKIHRS